MNTNTGQLYADKKSAVADLKPGETENDVVEILGTLQSAQRIAAGIRNLNDFERQRAKNKVAKQSRKINRK